MKLIRLYGDKALGAIHGLDRIRFRGTLRWLANADGLRSFLAGQGILLKHFKEWAQEKTARVRQSCAGQAEALGIPALYLRSSGVDKDGQARRIAERNNIASGPICQFSVVEPCVAPGVEGNRASQQLELNYRPRKCVFIYQYFDDPQAGLGHVRLQSWIPFGVTICLNGRHWLEKQLQGAGLAYVKDGNCFPWLEDAAAAQRFLDAQLKTAWPKLLGRLVRQACPGLERIMAPLQFDYYWSAEETEWASDVMFKSAGALEAIYPRLIRHAMIVSDAPAVLRYLGRRKPQSAGLGQGGVPDQVVSDCRRRYEGVRVKHGINRNTVKTYNKSGSILRVETTINNTREFKVFRTPENRPDRPKSWQKLRKGVADLNRRCRISQGINERYADALAAAEVREKLREVVEGSCQRITRKGRSWRAINPWNELDWRALSFLARGELAIHGFRNKDLRAALWPRESASGDPKDQRRLSARATRLIGLLRAHGLIKKVPRTSRYVLSEAGRKYTAALLSASATDVQKLMELAA